jgi:hypothetical protein
MTCEFDRHRRHYRDSAAMAAQSWPGANWHFSRRWVTPQDAPSPPAGGRARIRSSQDPADLKPPRSSAAVQAKAQS